MDIEEPLFQPFPSDIVFQNFEPFQTYEVPLQLRNNDKVCNVTQNSKHHFSDGMHVIILFVSVSSNLLSCFPYSNFLWNKKEQQQNPTLLALI